MEKRLDIRHLIAFTMSDIDIFLLREVDQTTDKDKTYTKEEIRTQLKETGKKVLRTMGECGIDISATIPTIYDTEK